MKIICSLAVIVVGIQSVCLGVCLGVYPQVMPHDRMPMTGLPPCHGGTLPNSERQSTNTDPCVEQLAIGSRSLLVLDHMTFPITSHEDANVVGLAGGLAVNKEAVAFETYAPPSQQFVLRI